MYTQDGNVLLRADVGIGAKLADPDLLPLALQYTEHDMAGVITLAMLAQENTRILKIRERARLGSNRVFDVEGKMGVLKIRDFSVLPPKGEKFPYTYQVISSPNQGSGRSYTMASLQPNLTA